MQAKACLAFAALTSVALGGSAPRPTEAPAYPSQEKRQDEIEKITDCHLHGSDIYCMGPSSEEYHVQTTPTQTTDIPAEFTGCHAHGEGELYCISPDGEDLAAHIEGGEDSGHSEEEEEEESSSSNEHCHFHAGVEHCTGGEEEEETSSDSESGGNEQCHFHAGVEHCVGEGESENGGAEGSGPGSDACTVSSRDYDVGLRVGLLFVILATSALGVFGPIFVHKMLPRNSKLRLIFTVLKQFGTGIIISTAFVHLYTHANMMFTNPCIGELEYEAVTSAIVMAGIFLSFLVEYIGQRIVQNKIRSEAALTAKERSAAILSSETVGILVMEMGIIFHSLLIGLTLVVAGDSFFITLFIVILFHQVFEGIALGTRIATVGTPEGAPHVAGPVVNDAADADKNVANGETSSTSSDSVAPGLSMKKKLILASLFSFITPIGMAIGIGVLNQFNGKDQSTLVAIGTLDAFSAGILIWVGVVEMWAGDWMFGAHGHKAELADADMLTTSLAGLALVTGMVLMSVLGMWA